MAYREQLGSNRQFHPSIGDTQYRYPRSSAIKPLLARSPVSPSPLMAHPSLRSHEVTQSSGDLHGAPPRHPRTGDDHDIYILVQQTPGVAEPLAHRTLDPIPRDRVPHLAAHRNPQPPHGDSLRTPTCPLPSLNPCRSDQHHELARCQPPPQPRDPHEISTGPESLPAPQATGLAHCTTLLGPDSYSYSLPPLRTSPLDDRLSPAGLHSPPEPVRPQPLDSTGLIGSLHLLLPTFPLPTPLPTFTKALCESPLPETATKHDGPLPRPRPYFRHQPTADPQRNLTHSTKPCTEDAVDRAVRLAEV
jgi:hypothetical protein